MRCTAHPDVDSIGICVSCGRAVCPDCKVNMNHRIHCKQCIEMGRVAGEASPPPPPPPPGFTGYQMPGRPLTPQGFFHRPSAPTPLEPEPKGKPSLMWFKAGFLGGHTGAIGAGLMAVYFILFSILDLAISSPLLLLTSIPLIIGMFGFYNNYGSNAGLVGGLVLLITIIINLAMAGIGADGFYSFISSGTSSIPFLVGRLSLGIGFFMAADSFNQVRGYIYCMGEPHFGFQSAILGMIVSSIMIMVLAIIPYHDSLFGFLALVIEMIAWGIMAVSIFGTTFMFLRAQSSMPDMSGTA